MAIMISRRKLQPGDFESWRKRFEADADNRRKAGCRGVQRFRGADDPDELIVIFNWDTRENAERYVSSKLAGLPNVTAAKRADGSPTFETHFYEAMELLSS